MTRPQAFDARTRILVMVALGLAVLSVLVASTQAVLR